MRQLNIALYVPSWPPGSVSNGIVTYASQLVPALRRLGHRVFLLTFDKAACDNDNFTIDLRTYAFTPSLWNRAMFRVAPAIAAFNSISLSIASAVKELVDRQALDVFEIEDSFGWSFAISRLKLLPVVVRLHGPWFLNGRFNDPGEMTVQNRPREKWERRGIQNAQFVSAPSAEVLRAIKDRYHLAVPASQVIPNPIEANAGVANWNVETCKQDSLLYVGRFDRRKGADLVLRVFGELAGNYQNLKLTFVGPDKGIIDANGNIWTFADFVRNCIPEGARSRIEFLGQMKHSDVMSLRLTHFASIIASQYEIMPYSVLEPMSLGSPLIATAVGGIPELIQDQRNGLLVPSQDTKAMVAACRTLLDDHSLAARLGHQAWQDCRNLYDPEYIAKETVVTYENVIEQFKTHNGHSHPNQ